MQMRDRDGESDKKEREISEREDKVSVRKKKVVGNL